MSTKNESIECRYCDSKLSRVVESRIIETTWRGEARTIIRRARQCLHCGYRYFTVETYEALDEPYTPELPADFINLEVKERIVVPNPLDSILLPRIAPPPARGDAYTQQIVNSLSTSPKENPAGPDGPLTGPDNPSSLGRTRKRA